MSFRPRNFLLRRSIEHPLSKGNQLALLSRCPGSSLAFDSSPFGRHGTLTNMDPATDWQPDPELGRQCIVGDGLTKYLSVPPFKLGNSGTISLWVNYQEDPNAVSGVLLRISANAGGSPIKVFDVLANRVPLATYGSYSGWYNSGPENRVRVTTSLPLTQYVWSLVELAWTINGATTLRIDGNAVGTPPAYTTEIWDTSAAIFEVMRDSYFQIDCPAVKIADFCVWDRLLTSAERQILLSKKPDLGGWIVPATGKRVIPWVGGGSPPARKTFWMGVCV